MAKYPTTPRRSIVELDFDRLAGCYKRLHWKWKDVGVPDADNLREVIDQLTGSVLDRKNVAAGYWEIGTGGLHVSMEGGAQMVRLSHRLEVEYAVPRS